jgi:hypothetical protein
VEEEFESAQMYKRLSDAAAMYQIGKTGLWRPPDLQLALNWQKKQRPTREWAQRYDEAFERAIVFLDTSRITYEAELRNSELQQRRMLRRARATAIILGIAAVIAMLFFVFAYLQKIEADNQTLIAKQRQAEALTQREEATRQRDAAEFNQKQAEKSKQEAEAANLRLQEALNEATRQRNIAIAEQRRASREEQKAILAGEKEKEQRIVAERETERANQQYERANSLYMLTVAQKLAGISYQEDDDKDLAGAQVMQAFHFHRRYEGKKYDPYIYNGLYHALTLLSESKSSFNAMKVPGPPRNRINSIEISSTTSTYYAAGADGRIFTGNYEKQTSEATGFENPYPNRVIALSKDEHFLANGTDSAEIQIFDVQSQGTKPVLVKGLTGVTNAMEFLPDNSGLVVAKSDGSVSLVDHKTGSVKVLASLPYEVKSISLSPDGKYAVGGSWSGKIVRINLENKETEVLVDNPAEQILSVRFSPGGNRLAYGTFEVKDNRGLVKLYNLAQRKDERQFTGHKAGVYDVEFSPDGKLLASAGSDRRLQM